MNDTIAWLSAQGLAVPRGSEATELAIVFGLIVAALALGALAGRWLGPPIEALWRRQLGHHAEGIGPRVPFVVRHGAAALLLAILQAAGQWPPLAAGLSSSLWQISFPAEETSSMQSSGRVCAP